MINTRKELNDLLKYEFKKYNLTKTQNILGFFNLSEKGIIWKLQKRLRKYEYFINKNKRFKSLIYHFLYNRIALKYGISIRPNSVGKGLIICHLGSIIIRGKIGNNATIHINTAMVGGGSIDEAPTCGENLYLSIGSTIVGPVKIGNNVCVGAGAVVVSDVDDNSTVGGVPAKLINKRGPLDW